MTNIWFTSDQHLGHENIIGFCQRPFVDVDEMDETIIAKWQAVVQSEDLVYLPGDLAMGAKDYTLGLISRLPGRIILLPGNHDACWIGKTSGARLGYWRKRYLDAGIAEIIDTGAGHPEPIIEIAGRAVKISHFPYIGDRHERQGQDKFSAFRPDDDGGWLLHGHTHGSWKVNNRMIDVGVDVWDYAPVHIDQIAEIILEEGALDA